MRLLKVDKLEEAREKLQQAASAFRLQEETVPLCEAEGRVLSQDVRAAESVPGFAKSTMDGYAVRAKDTQGVTDSIPCFLEVVDEIKIGHAAEKKIGPGQCAYVPTGGMLPEGADAVVMIEYCEHFDDTQLAVYNAVSPGRNVVQEGEDIQKDAVIMKRGSYLRPQEIAALASCGVSGVPLYCRPKITIISTGDELVGVDDDLGPGQIRDTNTWGLKAQCARSGIQVVRTKVLKDDEELLRNTIRSAMEDSDIVVTSGGSSQGKHDFTAKVIDGLSHPGVFVHGIALKPGKPTIIAFDQPSSTLLMGLPGHPVASMVVFEFFVVWLLRQKMGMKEPMKFPARIENNVAGGAGRAYCLMVQLIAAEDGWIARPVLGKSALITVLTRADGYTFIDTNKEGLKEGEQVMVNLF
ncbi:MAG: gephyrin-like molybdotransferase Glp [Anaerovoracaceae bacterium]|jgi:molybdopterin molybdotransferase